MRQTLTPEAAEARHAAVDTLRGAALCGVLLVNLLVAFRVSLLQHILEFHTHPGRLNQAVDLLLGVFVETKAVAIFSLLFGVSAAIHAERISKRGQSYAPLVVRRLLVLLGIGAVHMVFIWNGDILVEYALAGLVVLPALWLPRQLGLGAALCLLFLPTLPLKLPLPTVDWSAVGEHAVVATRVYSRGGYLEIFSFRQLETWRFIGPLLGGILLRTMGLMLLGQFVWRRGILRAPQAHRRLLGWVAGLGIPLGILSNGGEAALAYAHRGLGGWQGLADLLSTVPLALGYAALLVLLLQRPAIQRALSGLEAIGKMALTCYLGQSVVLGFIFYGYGLGLFGRLGSAVTAPLGLLLFGLQVAFCQRWLRRYQFGPVEWLWRSVTYGRLQPMRRQAEKKR
ncbi:MAG TPA: DUF418 domain-containing protein [Pseudomonadota bacterium]|nr:DUF418 domain-containing protein [Pseudomonadota bacterium]